MEGDAESMLFNFYKDKFCLPEDFLPFPLFLCFANRDNEGLL
jgi:hypothetical protein